MTAWCMIQLDWIFWLAVVFMAAALMLGAISAIVGLFAPAPPAGGTRGIDGDQIAPILEALKGLIDALGKAPAWFALFLAGLFLFWVAGGIYVNACKPVAPVSRTTTTSTTMTIITRTAPRS